MAAVEYTVQLQTLFLEMMLEDPQSFVRVRNIYNPNNFDRSLRLAADFIQTHSDEFKTLPDRSQVEAMTGVVLRPAKELNEGHYDWFLQEFEQFTKRKEIERAVLKAADLLEDGNFDPIEKLIKDAVQISLTRDMGTDYFADPRSRLNALRDNKGQVSTGWPCLDQKLFGGMNKGELNIFAGGSGSGKSLIMQNLACNWTIAGLNGIYITLELSEGLSCLRIDAMLSGMGTKEVFKELDSVELKIKLLGKKSGHLQVKYLPAQSNINDIRAFIKEYQIQTGMKNIDFLMVDYLDLLMPVSVKIDPSNLFVKDKYVSEELRTLAAELGVIVVSASQLNRSAVEEVEFDHSHISGGISKINTADNVFGIFTSRAMRERGKYQIQLMKTRSSSGVGQKVELDYDITTMRIIDSGEDQQDGPKVPAGNILKQIKSQSTVSPTDMAQAGKITATVQSSKLKDMLNNLKKPAD